MQNELRILDDCLATLDAAHFNPESLSPSQAAIAGHAAVKLALASLQDTPHPMSHPLGFLRMPVTDWSLEAPRAAVHVWDRRTGLRLSDDVHDHCYDFVSICLIGGLRHRIFAAATAGGESGRMASLATYAAGSCENAGAEAGEGRIVETGSFEVSAPHTCGLPYDVLHSAEPLGSLTATVQFQSPCRKRVARVFRSTPATDYGANCAAASSEAWIRGVLEEIMKGLHPCH